MRLRPEFALWLAALFGSAVALVAVVDWLLACPEKGYFVPIESESTDTL